MSVGWRAAGVDVLQGGIGEEKRCNGCKSREERVLLQSTLTNSGWSKDKRLGELFYCFSV